MLDFSSWATGLTTLLGLLVMVLMMMGVRLLLMQTVQKRRERENRQINERLRTLMAAYKTLGSSFTGNLAVNPAHVRDLHEVRDAPTAAQAPTHDEDDSETTPADTAQPLTLGHDPFSPAAERQRRIRDAVEGALSDIILLGTEEQVRMAAQAAQDMVEGRPVHTAALVQSLRRYIRQALYLEEIPSSIRIPDQGPQRPASTGSPARRSGAEGGQGPGGGRAGSGAGGGGAGGGGMGGMGIGLGLGRSDDSRPPL